jgi:hypothetical protein
VISTPTYSAGSGITFTGSNPTTISATPSTVRTLLTGPTTFYFSLTGNDNTGNGTSRNPWRHLQFAYQTVQQKYDAGGQAVTFHTNDTSVTFPDCFISAGPLYGQGNPGLVTIDYNNNTVQPATGSNCSNGNPYVLGSAFGGAYLFENINMSVCGTWNTPSTGGDMVNVGQLTTVYVGPNVTYGCAFGQWNLNSVNGILVVLNNFTIQAKNVTLTGTWSNGGSTIAVTDVTGLELGFGTLQVGPNDCYISSSTVSLPGTGPATLTMTRDINASGTTCTFSTSGSGIRSPSTPAEMVFGASARRAR